MTKATIRDWINDLLVAGLYITILAYAYVFYTTPANLTGKPCGGSIEKHWQWGGTPEHIEPVCVPVDAQSAKR